MSGRTSEAGVWKAWALRKAIALLLLLARDRVIAAVGVAEPEVGLDRPAEGGDDVRQLPVALADELLVHVLEEAVIVPLLGGRLDEVRGDAVEVLEAELGGGHGVGAEVFHLRRGVDAVRVAEPEGCRP